MQISIKEYSDYNNMTVQGIYQKMKRKKKELDGHVWKKDGVIVLDEVAQELLKPNISKGNIDKIKDLEEELSKYKDMTLDYRHDSLEQEELIERLAKELSDLKKEKEAFDNKIKEQDELIENLKKELSDLKEENGILKSEINSKSKKGFFSK